MLIQLIRNKPQGATLTGSLVVDGKQFCDTIEHLDYAIPAGFYRLRLTFSPKFKEILPILDNVIGYRQARQEEENSKRTGIRIHAGNHIRHTTGCILVGCLDNVNPTIMRASRKHLELLRTFLLNYQKTNPHEEIYIEICEPDPYPLANVECPRELQQY